MSDKKFTAHWFDGYKLKFTYLLKHFKEMNNIHFLEIGSFEGKSSCWFYEEFIENKPNSTLTCVDTWQGSMEHSEEHKSSIWDTFNHNVKDYTNLITVRGLSRLMIPSLSNEYYDFIYVDGSHTTRDVLQDAVLCFDKLKLGGIMTFDDYLWVGYEDPLLNPKTGIDAFLVSYKYSIEIIEMSGQVSIRKVKD